MMTSPSPALPPDQGVVMLKVAVLWRRELHAGSTGAFVLFHPPSLTPSPPHPPPFMYPDGVHFDLLCVCPLLPISTSYSFPACRRFPSLSPLSPHTHSYTHTLMQCVQAHNRVMADN